MASEVTSVSLDSLAEEHGRPKVVFVDVEGYECQVLQGGRNILANGADFFVEVHIGVGLERHGSVEQLLGFFPPKKYRLFWAAGELAPFQPIPNGFKPPTQKFFLVALAQA